MSRLCENRAPVRLLQTLRLSRGLRPALKSTAIPFRQISAYCISRVHKRTDFCLGRIRSSYSVIRQDELAHLLMEERRVRPDLGILKSGRRGDRVGVESRLEKRPAAEAKSRD